MGDFCVIFELSFELFEQKSPLARSVRCTHDTPRARTTTTWVSNTFLVCRLAEPTLSDALRIAQSDFGGRFGAHTPFKVSSASRGAAAFKTFKD